MYSKMSNNSNKTINRQNEIQKDGNNNNNKARIEYNITVHYMVAYHIMLYRIVLYYVTSYNIIYDIQLT